jgi:hypothetical protein
LLKIHEKLAKIVILIELIQWQSTRDLPKHYN